MCYQIENVEELQMEQEYIQEKQKLLILKKNKKMLWVKKSCCFLNRLCDANNSPSKEDEPNKPPLE